MSWKKFQADRKNVLLRFSARSLLTYIKKKKNSFHVPDFKTLEWALFSNARQ